MPQFAHYAAACSVGMIFIPNDAQLEIECKKIYEEVVAKEGLTLLGWRAVPVKPEVVGRFAKATQPQIWQIMVEGKQVGISMVIRTVTCSATPQFYTALFLPQLHSSPHPCSPASQPPHPSQQHDRPGPQET